MEEDEKFDCRVTKGYVSLGVAGKYMIDYRTYKGERHTIISILNVLKYARRKRFMLVLE